MKTVRTASEAQYLISLMHVSLSLKSWAEARFNENWKIEDVKSILNKASNI